MLHKVEICGVDTSQLKTLSATEAEFLMKRIGEGDMEARDRFVAGNLKLVLSITRRFINKKENLDDIFQIGIIGLLKAVDNFDPKYEVKFSTYAVPMIIGEIKRFLRDNTCMRVSRSIRDVAYLALQTREKLSVGRQSEPNLDEIAGALNMSYEEIACAIDSTSEPISLFSQSYNDGESTILEKCGDDRLSGEKLLEQFSLDNALKELEGREREIIDMRYYQGKTQIEVSSEIGISQAQVSRLEKNALKIISKNL